MVPCLLSFVLTFFSCNFLTGVLAQTKLSDVTSTVLGNDRSGVVGGFASLSTGQKIDIMVIDHTGKKIDVLFCQSDDTYVRETVIEIPREGQLVITGVASADFDGDGLNDYFLVERNSTGNTSPPDPSDPVRVQIYWGQTRSGPVTENYNVTLLFKDDPLIFDYNADSYPDLLGELHSNGSRVILLGGPNRRLSQTSFPLPDKDSWPAFMNPQSSAFVDVNNDMYADLVVTTEDGYEVHLNTNGRLQYNSTIPLPDGYDTSVKTQISVADINMDGFIDIIVPVCNDSKCSHSCIWVYTHDSWKLMLQSFGNQQWGFAPSNTAGNFSFPIALHVADYNRDGYPDALAFLQQEEGQAVAVLLDNTECTSAYCAGVGRTFTLDTGTILGALMPAVVGSFVDLYSNGVLDVIVVALTSSSADDDELYPTLRVYKQSLSADACFLKVEVSTGVCEEGTCTSNVSPYSVNQVGATIKYETTAVDGYAQVSSSGQLTQSAHFALQSPYALFGLGMTPNYVDAVIVGMAESHNASQLHIQRKAEWAQIIPNSQLLVLPYPLDDPDSWEMKLFVTPSELVMLTGFCLLGLCGLMAIIAGVLHWRERREDMEEKRQESHKFHFDAM